MSSGEMTTAERLRHRLRQEFGVETIVPVEVLIQLAEERQQLVQEKDRMDCRGVHRVGRRSNQAERVLPTTHVMMCTAIQKRPFASDLVLNLWWRSNIQMSPAKYLPWLQELIRIPSVTACPEERLDEVRRAGTLIFDYARNRGLEVSYYYQDKYPGAVDRLP